MRLNARFGALALGLIAAAAIVVSTPASRRRGRLGRPGPVKLILTLGPGSGADIGARLLADRLSQRWGQPVDRRKPARAATASSPSMPSSPRTTITYCCLRRHRRSPRIRFLHENLPYKPSDLVPITRVSNTIVVISVPASLNVDSLDQLVALARGEPGKLNWAGLTGALDFLFAGWLQQENLNITKVAYKNPGRCRQRRRRGPRAALRSPLTPSCGRK